MSEAETPAGSGAFPLPDGYDGIGEARRLLRTIRSGGLGTLVPDTGDPFVSLVSVATDPAGAPILLLSGLSAHTRNLLADSRVSLLLAETGRGDPLAHPRLTVAGRAVRAEGGLRDALAARFLARHPKSSLYAGFADFGFWKLELERAHLNGGFAKAASYTAGDILIDLADAQDLVAAEDSALAHLNADHSEALSLYATRLLREASGRWRATGLDPEGLDLAAGDRTARLVFPHRIKTADSLRRVLADLAAQARAAD